jgi:predicted peptidase
LAIARQFGEHTKNGRFEFVVLFPIDRTIRWQTGSAAVENCMQVLDHVIRRHRIDPARVYLTGASGGGSGVWHLAEAYPDRWAALAPVSSFSGPDVPKVPHLPIWIFHGTTDELAPVAPQRTLVQRLQEARAEVRYTEVPRGGHMIGWELYGSRELYDWFAQKKRRD